MGAMEELEKGWKLLQSIRGFIGEEKFQNKVDEIYDSMPNYSTFKEEIQVIDVDIDSAPRRAPPNIPDVNGAKDTSVPVDENNDDDSVPVDKNNDDDSDDVDKNNDDDSDDDSNDDEDMIEQL